MSCKRILYLTHSDAVHAPCEIVQIVERQVVEPDHAQISEYLAVAVYAQRKSAYDVLLRRFEFVFGRTFCDELVQRLAHQRQRLIT